MKKPKKILILGAKGMLGSDLRFVFKKDKPICWGQKDLDIVNEKEVERAGGVDARDRSWRWGGGDFRSGGDRRGLRGRDHLHCQPQVSSEAR